jgi:hypothetical protein
MTNAYILLVRKFETRDHMGDLGVEWRIILEWILKKQGGRWWASFI